MDITLCSFGCYKQETCVRFKGEPDKYQQLYFIESPLNLETKECEFYWEIKETTPLTIEEENKIFFKNLHKLLKELSNESNIRI